MERRAPKPGSRNLELFRHITNEEDLENMGGNWRVCHLLLKGDAVGLSALLYKGWRMINDSHVFHFQ